ncbi:DUF4808 domain-containing protein [Klenkia terrae]|uniref:DUF4808 domain-containing protein n=1 Tax=Klenkia terrae TaxID=1052259 RepID=A0ABU8EBW0_9ACTN|nr:DUF4808 domain-containing protein [Klenkia terrae]
MNRARGRWRDLEPATRTTLLVVGGTQLSLAVSAWTDLRRCPPDQVRGAKLPWVLVIAISWVGPLAWFRWGRRRTGRPVRGRYGSGMRDQGPRPELLGGATIGATRRSQEPRP